MKALGLTDEDMNGVRSESFEGSDEDNGDETSLLNAEGGTLKFSQYTHTYSLSLSLSLSLSPLQYLCSKAYESMSLDRYWLIDNCQHKSMLEMQNVVL